MALVHETLYKTKKYSQVDMETYLTTLVEQIARTYPSQKPVKTSVAAKGVTIDIARATPCGLIINELMTNSFKHAFPDIAPCGPPKTDLCTLDVKFTEHDGFYTLIVSDNGIGIPPSIDIKTTKSLGLKLVYFLAKHQLRLLSMLTQPMVRNSPSGSKPEKSSLYCDQIISCLNIKTVTWTSYRYRTSGRSRSRRVIHGDGYPGRKV